MIVSGGASAGGADDGYTAATEAAAVAAAVATALAGTFSEADIDAARQEGSDSAFGSGLVEASGWSALLGPTVGSSSALGSISRDQGRFACDVQGTVPADQGATSWVTVEATTPDGASVVTEFLSWLQLNAQPSGAVRPFLGVCTGPDLATSTHAVLFAVDNNDGNPAISLASKNNGTWSGWSRNSNTVAGALGVRGVISFGPQFSGDATVVSSARAVLPTGTPESASNRSRELGSAVRMVQGLNPETLHMVVGFDVLADVSPAIRTEVEPKTFLVAPPEVDGLSVEPTVWGAILGQSNAIGRSTGAPVNAMVGTYIQGSTIKTEWSTTDSHSSAAGMLTAAADAIPRGVYERGLGGTTMREQIDEVLPAAIASMQTRGIVPRGILMWQGEANANDAGRAAAYVTELPEWIDAVRAAFPDVHIYLVEVQATAGDYTEVGTVNGAMQAEASARSYVHILRARGTVELQSDQLHATSAGQISVGESFSAAMVALGAWDAV